MIDLEEVFDKHSEEYLKFDRIESKQFGRPDLCAFVLLDRLIPGTSDIVSASEHDEFFLGVSCEELAEVATEEDIIFLIRCGVRFSGEYNCLCMFA